jgi:hypothetical protein
MASRDWGDLLMAEFEVRCFTLNFLIMASIRLRFTPGFLSGAGFSAEQFAPAWL